MSETVLAPPVGARDATLVPLCKACQESAGLCVRCAERDRSLLPQLAQESWHKDAHSGPLGKNPPPVVELPELTKEERAEARKRARAKDRARRRLRLALEGKFTSSRPKRDTRAA